ncbi:MAG: tyrosine-type recombinase/integrase [Nanoarchaeota archaeon]
MQLIVKKVVKSAKIESWKEIHPYTLRHSFATSLIKNNYSLTDVQFYLGHKSPETSIIHTHTSGKIISIKSPFNFNSIKNEKLIEIKTI